MMSDLITFRKFLIFLAGIYLFQFNSFAAGGKISGKVTDTNTGEAIPGVNVVVVGTTYGATTNKDGEYFILNVPPGTVSLKATSVGYGSVTKTEIQISIDHTTAVNFKLSESVIELNQSIVVVAERPLVEKDLTSTRHFVSAEDIAVRPVSQLSEILLTLPGIDQSATGELSVRRSSIDQVAFLIDGMRASNPLDYQPYTHINLSSIQELEIITGGFNPEYGQAQSGVFNIVTKEGTKKLQVFSETRWIPPRIPHWGTAFYDYSTPIYWENTHARHLQWWIDNPNQWVDLKGIPGNDPGTSFTPEQAYNYYMKTHQPLTDYTNESGYSSELAIGGPLPIEDLFFYATGKYRSQPPVTGNSYRTRGTWFDGTLKLSYNISSTLKLVVSGFYGIENSNIGMEYLNADFINSYGLESKYAYYDFAGYPESSSDGETVQLTHVLNPSTFYQLQFSRTFTYKSQSTFPGDAAGWDNGSPVNDILRAVDQFGGAIPGGNSDLIGLHTSGYYYRGTDKNNTLNFSGDLVSQVNTRFQIKAGGDFSYYSLDRFQQTKAYNAIERNVYHPWEGNLYYQNKLEFEGLIINGGLRYDFYNPNDVVYDNPFDPFGLIAQTPAQTSKTKTFGQLSPRLGISHPISENTVLHFSYGHFFQRASFGNYGEGTDVTGILNTYLTAGTDTLPPFNLGNRNLKPEKTVEYEIGLEHNFSGIVANITAYYKDITNTIRTITVIAEDGSKYYTSGNGDYGDSKGVEISLRKPLLGIWGGYLNYTFTSGINGRSGDPTILAPPGTTVTQVIDVGDEIAYDDPKLKMGISILIPKDVTLFGGIFSDIQISLDYQAVYPNSNIGSDVFSEGGKQFERSADKNADLRIRKEFTIGTIRPAFFIEIRNLFNDTWTNIDIVKSASAEDRANFINSRFLTYPLTKNNGAVFPDQFRYRNLPRQITFGVAISY
jgi:outer membrane receptor protein involved in Fe transport